MKSASNTALFIQCPAPFADGIELERSPPGEASRYGSAVHAILAGVNPPDACARFDVVLMREEIEQHVARIQAAERAEFEGFELVGRELSRRYSIVTGGIWNAKLDEETHIYTGTEGTPLDEDEMGGTADVVYKLIGGDSVVVVDYKTGFGDFSRPASLPQLQTLGLMFEATHACVIHAPRGAPVMVHIEPFAPFAHEKHRTALAYAYQRLGSGFYRSQMPDGSSSCKYCPAKVNCPLQSAEILQENTQLLHLATGGGSGAALVSPDGMKGALFSFLQRLDPLEKQMRARLKADVEAGEIIYTPAGQLLQLRQKTRTNLSMASIRRNLPPERAEAIIADLKAAGCVEETEYLELTAK